MHRGVTATVTTGPSWRTSSLRLLNGSPFGVDCPMTTHSQVSVVDGDESVRESLPDLLREFGLAARTFASAEAFLASDCVGDTKCLILDIAMPGLTGPALQLGLSRPHWVIPIVFITGQRDEGIRPKLLEAGAVDCLFKPFSETALL